MNRDSALSFKIILIGDSGKELQIKVQAKHHSFGNTFMGFSKTSMRSPLESIFLRKL